MNRKRARKIAQQRMPTLQAIAELKKRADQAAKVGSMLCVAVARLGGDVEMSALELRDAPAVDALPIDGGGVRLVVKKVVG